MPIKKFASLLNFFRKSTSLLKFIFLAILAPIFSTTLADTLAKFGTQFIQKYLIFSRKAALKKILLTLFFILFSIFSLEAIEGEGKNIFSSSIYQEYRSQLCSFIQNHPFPNQELKKWAEINSTSYTPADQRILHEQFLTKVRALILLDTKIDSSNAENKESSLFLQDLVKWLYLEATIFPAMQEFFTFHTQLEIRDFPADLLKQQQNFNTNLVFNGLHEHSKQEDQFLQGNLPSKVISLPESKTALIRFGQPLNYTSPFFWWWINPKASDEFVYFIKNQKSHLYINLMKRQGMEGPITRGLENLEKELPSLYLVTLDKNSAFYWQTGSYNEKKFNSSKFKEIFLNKMSEEKGAYFWSHHLNKKEWLQELKAAIDRTHATYFGNKENLSLKERQDFIELTYLAILDRLVEKIKPLSMNITCRQAMDRAPSLMALWMLQKKLMNNQEISVWLLTPPLLIHNRASHLQRIERFSSAATRLMV